MENPNWYYHFPDIDYQKEFSSALASAIFVVTFRLLAPILKNLTSQLLQGGEIPNCAGCRRCCYLCAYRLFPPSCNKKNFVCDASRAAGENTFLVCILLCGANMAAFMTHHFSLQFSCNLTFLKPQLNSINYLHQVPYFFSFMSFDDFRRKFMIWFPKLRYTIGCLRNGV